MLKSKLKEALICFKNLRVTLPYPFQPAPPPEGYRGRVEVDVAKCIGCGACAMACPPRLINISDVDGRRVIDFRLGRCTYCARCADVCPVKAIVMSGEFELATDDKADLELTIELLMVKCEQCDRPFTTQRIRDKLICEVSKGLAIEAGDVKWLNLCPNCRVVVEVEKISGTGA